MISKYIKLITNARHVLSTNQQDPSIARYVRCV
jgi:hypothetical protein